jgi:hypothetical protein
MRQTVQRWLLSLGLALAAGAAAAQAVPPPDARAVREVIEAQLKALAADDAVRAFSYASPTIRTQFGDAATFMAMVRSGYPMVLRPAATAFFQPEAADGAGMQVVQVVQLRDRAGRAWRATYEVQRQTDGHWRINGCVVQADTGKSST